MEERESSNVSDGYVALFIRMLGLDHDSLDREQAVVALWKYSLGGKKYIDAIMQFPDCIHLILNLLRSESSSTCEAAAGLLRSIALVNSYRDLVANSGAIEEITGLLTRASTTSEVMGDGSMSDVEFSVCVFVDVEFEVGCDEIFCAGEGASYMYFVELECG